ncbi:Pre-mRNA-processing factor 17 [Operophtera brumata]|uniref:Pre-mRNA-processing factor 17 n=1 Tax=Operophtera brumata TaxID=104452 RepID=A0A0L7L8D6_OPEBR|nr:Pre-mRNA-processing factor 17 [Operophtera brumata]
MSEQSKLLIKKPQSKRKFLGQVPLSGSECESIVSKPTTSRAKKSIATSKRMCLDESTRVRERKKKTDMNDIFGLCSADDEAVLSNGTQQLPSFLSNREANGMQRSCTPTDGCYFIKLKVHNNNDAVSSTSADRWRKALLRLSCSFDEDSQQWKLLQRFVVESSKLFKDATPSLFSDK